MSDVPSRSSSLAVDRGFFSVAAANKPRQRRALVFNIGFSLSLLLILFAWFDFSSIVANLTTVEAPFVVFAFVLLGVQFGFVLLRWVYILKLLDIKIGLLQALSIYGISILASLFFITSIAGISMRALLLIRLGSRASTAVAALVAERVAALVGLCLCGLAGLAYAYPSVSGYLASMTIAPYLNFAIVVFVASAVAGILVAARLPLARRFAAHMILAFSSLRAALILATLSTGVFALGFAGLAVLASGMRLDVNPVFYISVMPAVALVTSLPISIGGWGVRESMMVTGLAMFLVPAEAAIALSVAYGLASFAIAAALGTLAALLGTYRGPQNLRFTEALTQTSNSPAWAARTG